MLINFDLIQESSWLNRRVLEKSFLEFMLKFKLFRLAIYFIVCIAFWLYIPSLDTQFLYFWKCKHTHMYIYISDGGTYWIMPPRNERWFIREFSYYGYGGFCSLWVLNIRPTTVHVKQNSDKKSFFSTSMFHWDLLKQKQQRPVWK